MNVFKKLIDVTGLSYLFKPVIDDEKERQDTIAWIDQYLQTVVASLQNDIEMEQKGLYAHIENQQNEESLGYIQYILKDKDGKRLELSQFSLVSCNSIKMTESYQQLKSFTDAQNYSIELKEINIDSNGADTYEVLDDQLDDFERYFIIIVSGW